MRAYPRLASLAPKLQRVAGFISTQWLIDRTANTALVVTLYDTLTDLEAGATVFQQGLANSSAAALIAAGPSEFAAPQISPGNSQVRADGSN